MNADYRLDFRRFSTLVPIAVGIGYSKGVLVRNEGILVVIKKYMSLVSKTRQKSCGVSVLDV